VTIRNTYVMVS